MDPVNTPAGQTPPTPSSDQRPLTTIVLDEPILRGETTIAKVDVRRPMPIEAAGLNIRDIVDMEVMTMIRLLERTTSPTLTSVELGQKVGTIDFVDMAATASGFWLPRVA